jgi:hypothetical protein
MFSFGPGLLIRTRRTESADRVGNEAERIAAPDSEGGPDLGDAAPALRPDGDGGGGGDGPGDDNGPLPPGVFPANTGGIIVLLAIAATAGVAYGVYKLGELVVNLFRGAIDIRWSNLGSTSVAGDGEDTIVLTDNGPGTPGAYTLTLTVPPWMTWWKAAELYSPRGDLKGKADCWTDAGVPADQGKKTSSFTIPASEVAGGFLVLKKAKAFGVHTAMYVIHDRPFPPPGGGPPPPGTPSELSLMVGRNLTVDWFGASGERP